MLMAIFYLFNPVKSDLCYKPNMEGPKYFKYRVFDQLYNIWDDLNFDYFYLLKSHRLGWNKYSRGNYIKSIDFKRDFHFNLRDVSTYVNTWDSEWFQYCYTNYGIAIILGPYTYNDYKVKTGEDLMFTGLTNSVVVAFRANQNKISIFNCKKDSCKLNKPAKEKPYYLTYYLNFNMHIVYIASEHKLKVYNNNFQIESNKILELDVNLAEGLTNGFGYIGLTATDLHCGLYNHLTGSYLCENGGNAITPKVTLTYNKENYKEGAKISVIQRDPFDINIEYDSEIDKSLMGPGSLYINNYLYEGCKLTTNLAKKYIYSCYFPEEYAKYTISYRTYYKSFNFEVDVQSSEISKLNFLYGRNKDEKKCSTVINGIRYLKYGSLKGDGTTCGGDFDLSEFNDYSYLIFYAQGVDIYGKPVKIRDMEKIRSALQLSCNSEVILEDAGNFIYKVGIKVTKKGTYSINSSYLDLPITFYVKNLVPSKTFSKCKIEDLPLKAYKSGEEVKYSCEFKDNDNVAIQIEEAITLKNVKFTNKIYRLNNNKEFNPKSQSYSGNTFTFIFETDYNGKYKFQTEFGIDKMEIVDSNQNIFYVSPEPTTLKDSFIFNFDIEKWIKIENTEFTFFNYYEDKEDNDNLFLIDLVDQRDPDKTKYSDIEQPFVNFDLSLLKGSIFEEHSEYKGILSFFLDFEYKNKKYILVKLEKPKEEMRRTTYIYNVTLDFQIKYYLKINYVLNNIGNYTVCRKPLNISNSIINPLELKSISAGSFQKVGEIVLRTDLDHLHNYFLNNQNEITYTSKCLDDKTCLVDISENSIEGIYDIKFTSNFAGEYNIVFKINGSNLLEGKDSCKVKVAALPRAYYISGIEPEDQNYTVDKEVKFEFIIKDFYSNIIDYDLPPDNFGLTYSVIINGVRFGSSNIKLEKGENSSYYIKEANTISGDYNLLLKTENLLSEIEFNYYKGPGAAYYLNSQIKLINNNKLNLNDISIAVLDLYDMYNNYINSDLSAYKRELKYVEIYAVNGNGDKIEYYDAEDNLFKTYGINIAGSYHLYTIIYGKQIATCYSCNFDVVDYGFDFDKSQLKMIGEKLVLMKEGNYYNLYYGLQRPAFEFDFITQSGLPSNEINRKETIIDANIISGSDKKELKKDWIDINKLIWTLPEDYELEKDKQYTIGISNNNTERLYYIKFVNYGEDESSKDEYSLKNTFISPDILYLKAGISDSIIIEFRGVDNLRYKNDLDINNLEIKSNFDDLQIFKKYGNKKGQFIVELKKTKACEYLQNCKISLLYGNEEFGNVQLVTTAGELDYFEVDSSSISDKDEYILNPGFAGSSIKFNLLPFDKYGNLIKDFIFDTKIYQEESFSYLFNVKHSSGYIVPLSSSTNPASHNIELILTSEKVGILTLSSIYLKNIYKIEIKPGEISKNSEGYLDGDSDTIAGTERKFIIVPKDINGNKITDKDIINKIIYHYTVKIFDIDGKILIDGITPKYNEDQGVIEYVIENKNAETKVVKAYYDNEEIILDNNIINVVNGDLNFNKTKLIYNEQKYSLDNTLKISLASLPIIDLQLYDDYENKVDVSNIKNKNFKLIVGDTEISNFIVYNSYLRLYVDETNIDKYFSIKSAEENYKLYVEIDSNYSYINIDFVDEAPQKDDENPKSLVLNTDNLLLKAGEEGLISLKFYSEKSKLIGNFFNKSEISVSCSDDKSINTEILYGSNYGTYNLLISSEKVTNGQISCSIIAKNVKKDFKLKIIPDKVKNCKLSDNSLPSLIAGKEFYLQFVCFDKYENKAYLDENQFDGKIINNKNENIEYKMNFNEDNSFDLYFVPNLVGDNTIISRYIEEDIHFKTLPGEISPENSYLEIKEKANAGEELDIFIYVLDKYNNVVDLKDTYINLFDLYFRYQEDSNYKKVDNKPEIIDKGDIKVIRYKYIVTKEGANEFRGIYKDTSKIIKCSNCEVKTNPGSLDLRNSDVYKFNTFSQTYTKLNKYNDNLYNLKENLLIKVYPKDGYGNKISFSDLNLDVLIDNIKLDKVDSNGEFLEFIEKSGKFSELSKKQYDLVIKNENGDISITYKVDVSGNNGFDENVDESKTQLLDNNLEFSAGKYGYFNLELRNADNIRYNKQFKGSLDIIPSDKENIDYIIYNQKSSTILVLVTSKKANVFPNEGKLSLNVALNGKEIFNLELLIHPGDLSQAKINEKNLEENNKLKSVSADESLRFSLIGYDSLNNRVLINANEAKLIVKNKNEVSYKLSFVDLITGEQNYVYDLTLVGSYTIKSGKNNKGEDLFNGVTYSVEVTYGEVCPEKTTAKLENNPISAGNMASVIISVRDKNNNEIELDTNILNKFSGYILSNDYEVVQLNKEYTSGSRFKYEVELNKIGNYQIIISFNRRKIKCDKLIVNPSICKPENTLIYSKDKNGEYIKFDGETDIYSSYASPLSLYLVFRDEFLNTISDIRDISVENAFLYGNNMETLYWTYKNGKLDLDLNLRNKNILEHLVTRIGKDAYNFNFTVKCNNVEKEFNLKVNHFGKKDDEKDYGNGDYVLKYCDVEPKVANFRAGTSFEALLTLRTEEKLIYNGEFNIDYIDCNNLLPENSDDSFTCTKSKKDIGIYSLKYYTTMAKNNSVEIYNLIRLNNSDNTDSIEFKVLLNNTYGIPCKEKTVIRKELPKKINPDKEDAIIEFTLKDKYDNEFTSDEITNNLEFENNGIPINAKIEYKTDSKLYSAKLEPKYPPKDLSIQLYYRDDENNVELFNVPQKSELEFDLDYGNTLIKSNNINSMRAGELLDLNIILYDKNMLCYDNEDYDESLLFVTVQGPLGKSTDIRTYNFKKVEKEQSECKYTYEIDINKENRYVETGAYSIVVYLNGGKITAATYTQTVISGDIDYNNFVIFYTEMEGKPYTDQTLPAGETIHFTAQAYDSFNNKIDHESLSDKIFNITISPEIPENVILYYNGGNGALNILFNTTKVDTYKFKYYYNGTRIYPNTENGPDEIIYIAGPCSAETPNTIYPNESDFDVSSPYNYTIICLDKYNNTVLEGGAKFTSEISLFIEESQSSVDVDSKVKDNEDGTYEITFLLPLAGEYSIYTYLDGKKYGEKKFNLTGKICPYYKCPNTGECKKDLRDCIDKEYQCPDEEIRKTKPFRCNETSECVDSMTKCKQNGTDQCPYMKALYPLGKNYLCSYSLPLDCKRKYPSYKVLCKDGICRKDITLEPNQRVCPIGKILCPDLTCANNINECFTDWPKCEGNQVRCPDQSCTDDQKNCPNTITCSNPNDFVCPDGTCVENEIFCAKLKTCPDETPYLCTDNSCAVDPLSCPHTVACGHGKSLCSDLICRETC